LNFDVWWVYSGAGNREQYLEVLNRFPMFFQTGIHAHFVALVIALARLFEARRDTINVPALVKLLGSKLSNAEKRRIEALIAEALPLWKKVTLIRSNVFAHRNNTWSVEELFRKADLTPNGVRQLIKLSKEIVNALSHNFDRSGHAFNLRADRETRN